MSTYAEITNEEIRTFFHKWTLVPATGCTKELCYEHPLRDGVVIRCMTSVTATGSRGKGKDAIRLFAVDTKRNKGYIATKRVYRTTNWQDNLKKCFVKVSGEAKTRLARENR